MRKFLLVSLLALSALFCYAQDTTPVKTPWQKGDFFVGVNSDVLGISIQTISLSPFIGYALTNDGMIYGQVFYTEDPRISTLKLGYNHRVYHSAYLGIGGSLFGAGDNWDKSVSLEFGVAKNLWPWLQVSPKLVFTNTWNDVLNDFYVSTAITFAVRI